MLFHGKSERQKSRSRSIFLGQTTERSFTVHSISRHLRVEKNVSPPTLEYSGFRKGNSGYFQSVLIREKNSVRGNRAISCYDQSPVQSFYQKYCATFLKVWANSRLSVTMTANLRRDRTAPWNKRLLVPKKKPKQNKIK